MTVSFRIFGFDKVLGIRIRKRNDLKSIGTRYGGWVIPTTLLDAESICYCAGCGEDISFDMGLIEEIGCDVFAFDPTPRAIKYVSKVAGNNSQYHFFDVGLWDREDKLRFYVPKNPDHVSHSLLNIQKTNDYIDVRVNSLPRIMESLGHRTLNLLKLDIEGSEYKVIQSIIENNIEVNIICIEYDECFNPIDRNYKNRIKNSVKSMLEAGYSLVCAQGDGNYTFVNDSILRKK